jgi:hypothetical protein
MQKCTAIGCEELGEPNLPGEGLRVFICARHGEIIASGLADEEAEALRAVERPKIYFVSSRHADPRYEALYAGLARLGEVFQPREFDWGPLEESICGEAIAAALEAPAVREVSDANTNAAIECDVCVVALPVTTERLLQGSLAFFGAPSVVLLRPGSRPSVAYAVADHLCIDVAGVLAAVGRIAAGIVDFGFDLSEAAPEEKGSVDVHLSAGEPPAEAMMAAGYGDPRGGESADVCTASD